MANTTSQAHVSAHHLLLSHLTQAHPYVLIETWHRYVRDECLGCAWMPDRRGLARRNQPSFKIMNTIICSDDPHIWSRIPTWLLVKRADEDRTRRTLPTQSWHHKGGSSSLLNVRSRQHEEDWHKLYHVEASMDSGRVTRHEIIRQRLQSAIMPRRDNPECLFATTATVVALPHSFWMMVVKCRSVSLPWEYDPIQTATVPFASPKKMHEQSHTNIVPSLSAAQSFRKINDLAAASPTSLQRHEGFQVQI